MPDTHRPYAPEQLAQEYEPSAGAIRNWVAQRERDAGVREDGLRCQPDGLFWPLVAKN